LSFILPDLLHITYLLRTSAQSKLGMHQKNNRKQFSSQIFSRFCESAPRFFGYKT